MYYTSEGPSEGLLPLEKNRPEVSPADREKDMKGQEVKNFTLRQSGKSSKELARR